jgi:hypothetical protein
MLEFSTHQSLFGKAFRTEASLVDASWPSLMGASVRRGLPRVVHRLRAMGTLAEPCSFDCEAGLCRHVASEGPRTA